MDRQHTHQSAAVGIAGSDRTDVIRIPQGAIQVDTSGSGQPFLIVHSLLTGPESFDEVAASLASRHTVHRVYLPGFGRSTPLEAAQITIADLADVVAATMVELGGDAGMVVLGNGLGSFVALELAIRHGSLFGDLIVANTGHGFPVERRGAFAEMSRLALSGGMASVADVAIQRIFPPAYHAKHPEAASRRRQVLLDIDPRAFSAACLALAELDLRGSLESITNRALVVVGDIDQTTPPEMGRELAILLPKARLVVIPECGHCPQLEQPVSLLSAITDFLAPGAA